MARLLAFAVLAAAVAACSPAGGSSRITVTGEFSDVSALEHHATVEMNGVGVGVVTHIRLDQTMALLTMSLEKSSNVPADVTAEIFQPSLLGPDVVELVVPAGSIAGPLRDHAVIADAAHPAPLAPDLETLIKSGTDLLGTLGAEGTSALARVIAEGARGFGPEGGDLRAVIDQLDTVMNAYAGQTRTIDTLLAHLATFSSQLGPQARADAQALANLAATTAVLDRQKERLVGLLASLNTLSVQGSRLLGSDLGLITDQLRGLRTVIHGLANQQDALGRVVHYLNGHNLSTARDVSHSDDFTQVLNDFVVCGLPGGGEVPNDPLNSCSNVPQAAGG